MLQHLYLLVASMIAPFGSWESPLTSDAIVQESIRFYEVGADEETLYWTELHPKEKGRLALIQYTKEQGEIPLAEEMSVRSRVHQYGGGAFCVHKGTIYFSNDEDRSLYTLEKNGQLKKITDTPKNTYADGTVHPSGKFSIWVCETEGKDVENYLVRVDENGVSPITRGHDFYSCPRISPDGTKVAFYTWDFPNMPWDGSTLWLADLDEEGNLHHLQAIAGGNDESICQIKWSPNGILHFVSDKTGFWNLYRYQNKTIEPLCEVDAEFGYPAWVFGYPTYAFLFNGKIIAAYTIKGVDHLGLIDPEKKTLEDLQQPFTMIHNVVALKDKMYCCAATPTLPLSLICYDPKENTFEVIKESSRIPITEEWMSQAELIEYPSLDGKVGYGFYYPPKNPNFQAPENEKSPLIVRVHGGPTARAYSYLSLEVQYWTTRGFAFLDVNYGGSTGFGREYFKRLEGNWGVLDVADAISATKSLVEKGLADKNRLLIRGGSAGGYTTLMALALHDLFAAGTSYYGVSDIELLCIDDHKFESQYTFKLVGPYPEEIDLIKERSPINHIDKLSSPLLLLQGEEDKVVPPNQTTQIYEALLKRMAPVGMLLFEGEGHGFRKAPSIKKSLDAELYFYSKILGIELPIPFEELPIEIANLNQ